LKRELSRIDEDYADDDQYEITEDEVVETGDHGLPTAER